ncbi:MAG: hypothetical protein QX196_08135 [Methylococcaceae bacterium]
MHSITPGKISLHEYLTHNTDDFGEFKNSLRDGGSGNADWPLPPKFDENIPPAVDGGVNALASRKGSLPTKA